MRNVWLYVIRRHNVKHSLIVPARIKSFTCRNCNRRFITNHFKCVKIIGRYGFFKKHRLKLFKLLCYFNSCRNIKASVSLNQQIYLIAHCFTHWCNTTKSFIKLGIWNIKIVLAERVPFHCGYAALYGCFRLFSKFLGFFCARKPAVYIYPNLIIHLAAHKLIHRHIKTFAENIPQRHFYRWQCRHQNCAATPVRIAIDIMPMLFNIKRVLSDKIFLDMLYRSYKCLFLIFKRCFSDSINAFIGINLYKDPICTKTIYCKSFS